MKIPCILRSFHVTCSNFDRSCGGIFQPSIEFQAITMIRKKSDEYGGVRRGGRAALPQRGGGKTRLIQHETRDKSSPAVPAPPTPIASAAFFDYFIDLLDRKYFSLVCAGTAPDGKCVTIFFDGIVFDLSADLR